MATSLIDFNALRPNAAMEAYQQGQQNQLAQMQLGQQQQAIRDAEAEREAYKGAANFGEVSQRLMKQGLGKQALAVSAAEAKQRADKIALLKDTTALMKNTATQIMANPAIAKEALVAFGQQTGTDVSRDLAQLDSYAGNADAIKQWAAGHALEADKLLPKFENLNLSGGIVRKGYDPLTGKEIASGEMTPVVPLPANVEAQKTRISRAGAPTVNVSTEKKYSEQFAGKMADTDIGKMTAAEKAPELAANANRVIDILGQGNVFTGPAADIKLNLARALNVGGANNDEAIANTELLISGLARNTLGAVKSSGLGSGQGFTDKDLKFLQDAEGGRITLNAATLQNLAELSHKAAEGSANSWNTRVKSLPKSAVEGTGLSIEPIQVPKRSSVKPVGANPKPAGSGQWEIVR